MSTGVFCGVAPFIFRKKTSGIQSGTKKILNSSKKVRKDKNGSKIRNNSSGVAGNFVTMTKLRTKISTFRDLLDFSPCVASVSIKELLILTLHDLFKRYPKIKRDVSVSNTKDVSMHKALKIFCGSLKSLGDLWTTEEWMGNYKYDPSKKLEQLELEQIALGLLEEVIKLARERIFDEMDEEEDIGDYNPQISAFSKDMSEFYYDSTMSFVGSPVTPTSVLSEALKAAVNCDKVAPYSPPMLLPLRVQAIGKLNPIDVKRLSFHIFPHAVDPKLLRQASRAENGREEHREQQTECEAKAKPCDDVKKAYEEDEIVEDMEMSNEDNIKVVAKDESSNIGTCSVGRIDNKGGNWDAVFSPPAISPVAANVVSQSSPPQPSQPTPPSRNDVISEIPAPPPPPVTSSPPPLSLTSAPPPPPSPLPPPPPSIAPKNLATAPPPPPLPPRNAASVPPPRQPARPRNGAPPPPPPPRASTGTASPPPFANGDGAPSPPPPPGAATGTAPPPPCANGGAASPPAPPPGASKGPPPPMGKGGAPPAPPPLGFGCLRAKKATKLKRSSQMGNLYRKLKSKVEGSSLEGKSAARKGKIGGAAAAGGKHGMADALAEMTKRSSYFQQIEEDVKNYGRSIKELKTKISSFQTSDMNELIKFHKYVESHLEKLTDETQVLARFEGFPSKKLEALRMAASLYSKLDSIANTLKNWPIDPPFGQLLEKVEGYFNKIKVEMDSLERTKDEEAKTLQAQKIAFDFGILLRIKELMVDVSSNCMELALKEKREDMSKEQKETKGHGKKRGSAKTLWRAFQFAYRVYTFAGGHDDRADRLTRELAHEIETEH